MYRKPIPGLLKRRIKMLESLDGDKLKSICTQLGMPYLESIAPRLVAKRMERISQEGSDAERIVADVLRKPVLAVDFPENSDDIIESVALRHMEKYGIERIDDLKIPLELPDCFGLHDWQDVACKPCPYKISCIKYNSSIKPVCFQAMFDGASSSCRACVLKSWCSTALVVK